MEGDGNAPPPARWFTTTAVGRDSARAGGERLWASFCGAHPDLMSSVAGAYEVEGGPLWACCRVPVSVSPLGCARAFRMDQEAPQGEHLSK